MSTREDVDDALRALLADIVPEGDVAHLDVKADIRASLDMDSFDFLQFLIAVNARFGVEIPESDYAQVRTLEGCRRFVLAQRSGAP